MKWVYVPLMFALAFAYTKISFNDFGNKLSNASALHVKSSRAPASAQGGTNSESPKLVKYPSVVLYKKLKDPNFVDIFHKVLDFRGTIVGNPHVESFGFIATERNKAVFSLRDFPDVSNGVYLHDVMAHLVSAKSIEKKVSWIQYYESYKSGLLNQPHMYSYYVEKGLDSAAWTSKIHFEENVTQDIPLEFTKLKKSHQKITVINKLKIQDALKKKFPKIEFFDFLESKTRIKNYQILARFRPQDKIHWIEMKDANSSKYEQVLNVAEDYLSFEKRFELLKLDILGDDLSGGLDSITVGKTNYIIKYSDYFSGHLKLSEIPTDDYLDIILDEAYVLGKIHKRSLGERTDDYIKSLATIPGSAIDEKIIELKYHLKDFQE